MSPANRIRRAKRQYWNPATPTPRSPTRSAPSFSLAARQGWFVGFGISFVLLMAFLYATAYLFAKGVGIWGTTIPIGWAFPIVNFVWWVGIGHAGTLISAILLLLQSGLADQHQPFCRGDDAVRRRLRGLVPIAAPGAAVGLPLAHALSKHDGPLAATSAVPWFGTCLRCSPISRFRYCSGTPA